MTRVAAHAEESPSVVKRYLPFIIIAVVALLTVGIATMFYRTRVQPAPAVAAASATVTPTPAEEKENETLHVRGPRSAPVTMEVYGDFQCPSCANASRVIKELEKEYDERVRVIFYQFPLAMHNHAVAAATAAEAASLQGKFWEMHDQLYQYQSIWSKVSDVNFFFEAYAEAIGLDVARFRADRQSPDVQQRVISQGEAGVARGVKNTPTIFVNGIEMRSGFTREKIKEAIGSALAAKGNS